MKKKVKASRKGRPTATVTYTLYGAVMDRATARRHVAFIRKIVRTDNSDAESTCLCVGDGVLVILDSPPLLSDLQEHQSMWKMTVNNGVIPQLLTVGITSLPITDLAPSCIKVKTKVVAAPPTVIGGLKVRLARDFELQFGEETVLSLTDPAPNTSAPQYELHTGLVNQVRVEEDPPPRINPLHLDWIRVSADSATNEGLAAVESQFDLHFWCWEFSSPDTIGPRNTQSPDSA